MLTSIYLLIPVYMSETSVFHLGLLDLCLLLCLLFTGVCRAVLSQRLGNACEPLRLLMRESIISWRNSVVCNPKGTAMSSYHRLYLLTSAADACSRSQHAKTTDVLPWPHVEIEQLSDIVSH